VNKSFLKIGRLEKEKGVSDVRQASLEQRLKDTTRRADESIGTLEAIREKATKAERDLAFFQMYSTPNSEVDLMRMEMSELKQRLIIAGGAGNGASGDVPVEIPNQKRELERVKEEMYEQQAQFQARIEAITRERDGVLKKGKEMTVVKSIHENEIARLKNELGLARAVQVSTNHPCLLATFPTHSDASCTHHVVCVRCTPWQPSSTPTERLAKRSSLGQEAGEESLPCMPRGGKHLRMIGLVWWLAFIRMLHETVPVAVHLPPSCQLEEYANTAKAKGSTRIKRRSSSKWRRVFTS